MKVPFKRLTLIGLVVATVALSAAGAAFAQDVTPPPAPEAPPACVPDDVTSCVNIVFYPGTLVGDLYLVDTLVDPAVEQPTTQVQLNSLWATFTNPAPGMSATVIVKNIHDGAPDNGALYIYPDISQTVSAPTAGSTRKVTLYPTKKFIRGKVDAKCSPNAVAAEEEVGCAISIDGVVQALPILAGQKATFILDPGKHTLQFDLIGASAPLWSPLSQIKTVTVYAGSYPMAATASFIKAGRVIATLSQAADGWVGDFFVDGELAALQVSSIDGWVLPNKTHKIEVRNLTHLTAPGIHPYKDATASFYAYTASTKSVSVLMKPLTLFDLSFPSDICGNTYPLMPTDYVGIQGVWTALTVDMAEDNANHLQYIYTLDGVNIGDTRPYRFPAFETSVADLCGDGAADPFAVVSWIVPLGRMAVGVHSLHIQLVSDAQMFDGVYLWDPGVLIDVEGTLEILSDQPAEPAP